MKRVAFVNTISNGYTNTIRSSPTQLNTIVYEKGDSGATTHFVFPEDACVLSNRDAQPGSLVTQLDGTIMRANGSGYLPLHCSISLRAKKAQILVELRSASLVELGLLCDNGCTIVLTDKDLVAIKNNSVVLRGK